MNRMSLVRFLFPLLLGSFAGATDLKVACVGNSITYGYGLSYLEKSYPSQLDSLLGSGYAVTNFGVSGKTMVHSNEAYWIQKEFAAARDSLPNIVVIELGTNDSKDYVWPYYKNEFESDYLAMIDTFRVLASQPDVWVTIQPRANNAEWVMFDTVIANRVNPLILDAALKAGTGVIDLRAAFAGHGEWMQSDSVHPNAVGALQLAKTVAGMLSRSPIAITKNASGLIAPTGYGYRWYRNDSLLPDTAQTLAAVIPGNYKVSVKVEATTLSRQVSGTYALSSSTGVSSDRTQRIRIWCDASGNVQSEGTSDLSLRLRDVRGQAVATTGLHSGVYLYALKKGSQTVQQGKFTVP
jgi:lysophospholipase L1-like esterase